MNNDVTVLVCSCDKYEDAWEPFFRLFKIMGADKCTGNPIVLNTETKQYKCDFLNVKTVNTPNTKTWSERMISVVDGIETEFVFFLLEDFFIQSPFNLQQFNKVIDFMRNNPDVGAVHTTPSSRFESIPDEMFFERTFEELRITVTAVIWRKDYLRKMLRKHEDIWQFEWYSGFRAQKLYTERIMQYNQHYPIIYEYCVAISDGYGITESKWLPKNKELFDKYGIDVNYENLGWWIPPDEREQKPERKTAAAFVKRVIRHYKNKLSAYKSLR